MGSMQLEGMLEMTDPDTALSWHLQYNHYPPIPLTMLSACKQAIIAATEGFDDKLLIDLPDGVTWRGQRQAPAYAIIEGHHLQGFVDNLYQEALVRCDTCLQVFDANELEDWDECECGGKLEEWVLG